MNAEIALKHLYVKQAEVQYDKERNTAKGIRFDEELKEINEAIERLKTMIGNK